MTMSTEIKQETIAGWDQLPLFETEPNTLGDGSDETTFRATLDPNDLPAILEKVKAEPEVSIDCETTGLDYTRDTLHGISLATPKEEWYISGKRFTP